MTAAGRIYAGSRLTAAMVQAVAPLSAYKSQVEIVTSSTVLQNDDALLLPELQADAVYMFICVLGYNGGTLGSSDIKLAWLLPSGAVMSYALYGNTTSGAATNGYWETQTSIPALGTNGTGTPIGAVMAGTVATSATPGAMQLQWAQHTSSATPTTVLQGSVLGAWQVQ